MSFLDSKLVFDLKKNQPIQVPGRVRVRQILLRVWRGGAAQKPEDRSCAQCSLVQLTLGYYLENNGMAWYGRITSLDFYDLG